MLTDAASKAFAQSQWTHRAVGVGPVRLSVTSNAGVSFSWLSSLPLAGVVVVGLALVSLVAVAFRARSGWSALGFGAILGGAVSNAADRFGLASHSVVDFIGVGNLFVCNVADIAISAGVIVLGVISFRGHRLTR